MCNYFVFVECRAEDRLEQPDEMAAAEGGHVTLHCKYITDDPYPYLFWYQQKLKVAPKFILSKLISAEGSTDSEFQERFNASLDTSTKAVPLSIQDLQISDSAVYYCALRPTVMAACSALVQKPLAHIPLNTSFLTKLLNFRMGVQYYSILQWCYLNKKYKIITYYKEYIKKYYDRMF